MFRSLAFAAALLSLLPVPSSAQVQRNAGPRFGVTLATGELADRLDQEVGVSPVFTQFGWQFERVWLNNAAGPEGITEVVLLAGGLEQGVVLPSLTWLVGIRTPGGVEAGVGPNVSVAGVALALAGGVTLHAGNLNFPLSLAAVPSGEGLRLSLLVGFTTQRE